MSKFSVSAVERLDYDFTGIERDGGGGLCTGKGTVPEPSQKDLDEYLAYLQEIEADGTLETAATDSGERVKGQLDEVLGAVAKLCKGSPSQEELAQLPPRIKIAFARWLSEEFTNPNVSSAAIRR